jgi:4,5-DOPA dioxygenase extradiol
MNLNDLQNISENFNNTQRMPVLFLGHGSPMNAIEENQFVQGFRKAQVKFQTECNFCISAHWYTRELL